MTAAYWSGILTVPAVVLVTWAALIAGAWIVEHAKAWKPTYLDDLPRRADYAAAMVAARRVRVITALGWRFATWQIGARTDDRRQVWARTRDAVTNALGADVAERPYSQSIAQVDGPDWADPR